MILSILHVESRETQDCILFTVVFDLVVMSGINTYISKGIQIYCLALDYEFASTVKSKESLKNKY